MIFKEEIKEYVNRLRGMKDNMATIQAVVWGQCSESMKSKVKSIPKLMRPGRQPMTVFGSSAS
jgi:hypothetical protein